MVNILTLSLYIHSLGNICQTSNEYLVPFRCFHIKDCVSVFFISIYDFFDVSNIKFNQKNINLKKLNEFSSINKSKNNLYTTNGINLEEGRLYKTGQTKKELDNILKKIEPFLIKQFKETI